MVQYPDMFLKILNLEQQETPIVLYAWSLKFLLKIGFIIGWTTILALFISFFPTVWLPLFFLAQAMLGIAGMLFYSFFLRKYEVKSIILFSVLIAAILFLIAASVFQNLTYFFILILIGHSIFLAQAVILLSSHVEHYFTPAQCQRIATIIESAETIAGIIGGIVIAELSYGLADSRVLYLWSFFLFVFCGLIGTVNSHGKKIKKANRHRLNGLVIGVREVKKFPFLGIVGLFILLQWMIVQLFEFQFTKIVAETNQHFSSAHETASHVTHAFGNFHTILHASALTVQLLIGSRIMKKIKGFGAFLLHSIVTFISLASFFTGFGTFTAFLARNNFEITSIIHKSAYELFYYRFGKGKPHLIRELYEGLVMPLGIGIAMILVTIINYFFLPEHSTLALHILLFLLTGAMMATAYNLHKYHEKKFTKKTLNPIKT